VAASLRNLALVLAGQEKRADAESFLERAVQLLTEPSSMLVWTLNDYADTFDHLRRTMEALRLRARARKIEARSINHMPSCRSPSLWVRV
jgi:hypothetical protein